MQLEDSFSQIAASTGKPCVVFCDRGVLDGAAYLPGTRDGTPWHSILRANRWTTQGMMNRYWGRAGEWLKSSLPLQVAFTHC